MSNGAKVALAVGAGYLLGRTRKMRFALMLAAAGITGKFPARPADVVAHGLKSLGGSAELSRLTEQLRGEVLGAARSAALTAVTNQVDSLNDRLQGVTTAVGADEVLDDVDRTVGDTVGIVGGRRRTRPAEDEYPEEDDAYDEPEYEDEEPLDVDEVDDDDDEDLDDSDIDEEPIEEEEPQPPVTRRRASRRAVAPRTSIRRATRAASHEESRAGAARHQRAAAPTKRSTVRRGR
ncbi:hypothetical protein A9W99_12080 [Mycobacterium sp. 1164966.3]|uniref:hypothetical protein n=1 Tax=Mycobacterium sp. 1164966.3 TaxID=1856861 RepID=UPI0007FC23B5|nr:hypothetical protein [Mycobacterium sp. 1164966.3]OBA82133.1 hypothetical protein A9W99_12080 [Mycobacterium sp. 1164966.3]